VELGNIRLRRGDLGGAEAAYVEAHERAWSPQPGLALLRLAQGDTAAAAAMIRSEIDHPSDVPWKERPPFGDLRSAPLLAAQAEIAAASGDVEVAASAAAALTEIVQRYPSAGLRAAAGLAQARAALVAGAPAGAIGPAREAVAVWVELEAPYDAAVARLVAGEALLALGDPGAARLEWSAARAAFERFGAEHQVVAVDDRLAEPVGAATGSSRSDGRAAPGVAELRRRGEHWALTFGGAEVVLPDLKGLDYLARLLAEPGREFAALELAAVGGAVVEAGLPVLDDEAKASYRRRLREVEEDIDEAVAASDLARQQLAERDKEYLVAELTRAVGLGGRSRTTGGTAERARTAVTRTLRYALTRVAEVHPDLGRHLARTVRTGAWCSYQPDPLAPVTWRVGSR
jgi:tetratricopeptide (TPR) repeat protein